MRFRSVAIFSLLLGAFLATPSSAQEQLATTAEPIVYEVNFPAEEAGSGDGEELPECKLSYVKYERYYLRGVKEPNYISYNGSSFKHCEKMCCYQDGFECKSFSYFSTLRVCFLMNVTQWSSDSFQMIKARPWTHVERVAHRVPEETTTTSVFNSPAWKGGKRFTKATTTTKAAAGGHAGNRNPPFGGKIEEPTRPAKLVDNTPQCTLRCLNDGKCELMAGPDGEPVSYCKCDEGYGGNNCENEVSTAGGFPVWIIVVIVLGSIILILFLTVFIMYQIYRRKTGEYRVVKQIQKWTRRGKKPKKETGNPEDFVNPDAGQTSPTTSVQSIHGSVTSSTTHSTTTSV